MTKETKKTIYNMNIAYDFSNICLFQLFPLFSLKNLAPLLINPLNSSAGHI